MLDLTFMNTFIIYQLNGTIHLPNVKLTFWDVILNVGFIDKNF